MASASKEEEQSDPENFAYTHLVRVPHSLSLAVLCSLFEALFEVDMVSAGRCLAEAPPYCIQLAQVFK